MILVLTAVMVWLGLAQASMPITADADTLSARIEAEADPVVRAVLSIAGICNPSGTDHDGAGAPYGCPLCHLANQPGLMPSGTALLSLSNPHAAYFSDAATFAHIRHIKAVRSRGPPSLI